MKSVIVKAYGGPEVLKVKEINKPSPKSNEILIKIQATAVTRASTMMRTGKPYFGRLFTGFKRPKVKTPGTDLAGVVEAIGVDVKNFKVGDSVIAATDLKCGAYADYICLYDEEMIVKKPEHISPEAATGIIDGGCTALAFLTDQVSIKPNDKILINGAAGSIGIAAIQLAKMFGAEVTAICSTKKAKLMHELGANHVLDYTKNELENCTETYDVIFDTIGSLSFCKLKRNMNKNGVFLSPVLKMSTLLTMLLMNPFSKKKLKFAATGLRKQELRMRDLVKITKLLSNNTITTVIDKVYALEEIQEAHNYVDSGHKTGNVIIKVAE